MKASTSSLIDQSEDQTSNAISPMTTEKRRRNVSDPSSEVLETTELLEQILVKLPIKTVFGFTLVSTYWNRVIVKLVCRLKVPRNPAAVFVGRLVLHNNDVKFTHIPLEGVTGAAGGKVRRTTITLNLFENENFAHIPFVIEHSNKGLMICSSFQPSCYFLYNPTTKKRVRIPKPINSAVMSMHICFETPSTYKMVAVCLPGNSDRLQLQVLERNDQNIAYWKNSGVDFPVLGSDVVNYGYGVDMDGTIYWPCYKSSGLMFYKVSEEILRWLPEVPQPYNNFSGIAYFGECKGVLRMVVDESMRGATFDMLELKTDHSTWFVKYHIDLTPRATRANPLIAVPILILALLPGEEEGDDPYLIVHILKEILSYNLKDGTIRKMYDLGLRPTESLFLRTEPWKYVHPYLQSPTYPTLTASSQVLV